MKLSQCGKFVGLAQNSFHNICELLTETFDFEANLHWCGNQVFSARSIEAWPQPSHSVLRKDGGGSEQGGYQEFFNGKLTLPTRGLKCGIQSTILAKNHQKRVFTF